MARPSVDRILSAAERTFAREGYGETSLRRLVSAAGMSTTAFYARFDTKEEVLAALVTRLLGDLQAEAARALAGARSPEQGIERGLEALVGTLTGHKRLVRITLTEAAAQPAVREALRQAYAGLVALLTVTLPKAQPALAWAYVGALQIQVARWAVFDEIDETGLAVALRSVAQTLLPAVARRS